MVHNYDENEAIDLDEVEDREYTLAPKDDYDCTIMQVARTPNKKGTGEYLKVEVVCDGPEREGMHFWDNLSVIHENKTAQNIARQQFKQLCIAVGIDGVVSLKQEDLDEAFLGESITCSVDIEEGTGGYQDKNVIKKYLPSGKPRQAPQRPVVHGDEHDNGGDEHVGNESGPVDFDDDTIPF